MAIEDILRYARTTHERERHASASTASSSSGRTGGRGAGESESHRSGHDNTSEEIRELKAQLAKQTRMLQSVLDSGLVAAQSGSQFFTSSSSAAINSSSSTYSNPLSSSIELVGGSDKNEAERQSLLSGVTKGGGNDLAGADAAGKSKYGTIASRNGNGGSSSGNGGGGGGGDDM